jgi:hypothetical protein
VVPLDLRALGGAVLCQRDAFLASLGAVSVSAELTKRVSAGLLGGEGFVLQRLEGSGLAFITAAGTLVQKVLAPGEAVLLDAGCLVALQPCVDYSVTYVGSIRRALFAGEGAFMARVTGPGLVVLQSVREHGTGRVGGAGGERSRGGGAHRRVVGWLALLLTASTLADARHVCMRARRGGTGANLAFTCVMFGVMCIVVLAFILVVVLDEEDQPAAGQRRRPGNFRVEF